MIDKALLLARKRKKKADGGQVDDGQAAPQVNVPFGELSVPHYTPSERVGNAFQSGLEWMGASPFTARHLREGIGGILGLTPAAIPTAAADAIDAQARGDKLGAVQAMAGMIPGAGPIERKVAEAAEPVIKGIRAYHGSPHDFDKFDLSKIGTGEGAQAYGHGLYFAEHEPVARGYRDTLSGETLITPKGTVFDPQTLEHLNVRSRAHSNGSNLDATIELANKYAQSDSPVAELAKRDLEKLLQLKAEGGVKRNNGRMYEVNINADPERFLDWDKPLPEGHELRSVVSDSAKKILQETTDPNVRNAAKNAYLSAQRPEFNGAGVHQSLLALMGKDQAANTLKSAGVPGIKYLDQGSRASGEGSRNYVVFDDKLIDILRKYGLIGAAPVGALAASQGDEGNMNRGGAARYALKVAKADGGGVFHGYIHGDTGGRTDNKDISVQSGAFVIPADILSGLGEGNSIAGAAALMRQLGMDQGEPQMRASGGTVGEPVPIIAASGELVVPPQKVAEIGGGDLDRGHKVLDAMIKHVRKKTIKTLRKLPGPRKN